MQVRMAWNICTLTFPCRTGKCYYDVIITRCPRSEIASTCDVVLSMASHQVSLTRCHSREARRASLDCTCGLITELPDESRYRYLVGVSVFK